MKINNNNNYKNKYYDNTKYDSRDGRKPKGDSIPDTMIAMKITENLPKGSVTLFADPYTNMEPQSIPYNVTNGFNPNVGGNYAGESNLDGGNVQQYANSYNSGFLRYTDFMRLGVKLNYHYSPIFQDVNSVGYALIDEGIKAMAEAQSLLGATTFTQLAVNNYVVETDMAMGSVEGEPTDTAGVFRYTDKAAALYAGFKFYQLVLMNLGNCFTWHNSFRLKQGTMIRSSWNREVPQLNALFGQFNKAAWINLMKGISMSFEGEYVDRSFLTQAAMLNAMPSRRSDSITDPVLELQTAFAMPSHFKIIYVANGVDVGTVFDFESDLPDFIDTIDDFNDRLAAENIMAWARNADINNLTDTAMGYFNATKALLDKIITYFTSFKTKFADYREALDVLSRTGTVGWFKGYKPDVTSDNDARLFRVLIIEDLFRLIMSGAPSVKFNNNTKRWVTYSLWNMYDGIPEYDSKQGGAFLTFSCKDLDFTEGDDDGNRGYIPVAIIPDNDHTVYGTTRDGIQLTIKASEATMSQDPVLARLVPLLSQNSLKIRVPVLQAEAANGGTITLAHKSAMYKTLCQIFGVGAIPSDNTEGDDDLCLDPDIIAIYQIEVEDITNIAINYARTNAPVRASSKESSFLGFFGTKQ